MRSSLKKSLENVKISIFDVIGPIMIGPSSSHTAGAARLGKLARERLGSDPAEAEIILYNSFAETAGGHGTEQAIISGILGFSVDDERLPAALQIAKARGLKYHFDHRQRSDFHPNSAEIKLISWEGEKISLGGSSLGGGRVAVWENSAKGKTPAEKSKAGKLPKVKIDSFGKLSRQSTKRKKSIVDLIKDYEKSASNKLKAEIEKEMLAIWKVMKEAAEKGVKNHRRDSSNLFGGDAWRLLERKNFLLSKVVKDAMAYAVALGETNVRMGRIVAAPTAGSCGILPGCLMSVCKNKKIGEDKIVDSLFVAASVGMVIVQHATVAGSEGGCMAECGSASAMAAAALTYIFGGTNEQIDHAAALALSNFLGLVCDAVGGGVAVPCILRNGLCASCAMSAAEAVLSGVDFAIPFDEVVETMGRIGKSIPMELKETGLGGLAITDTAKKITRTLTHRKHC